MRLSAADAESGVARISYRLDGGAWRSYARPLTIRGTAPHRVQVRAVNRAGTTSAVRTTTVRARR